MVTPLGPFPAGSPAAATLAASENGHYVACALGPAVVAWQDILPGNTYRGKHQTRDHLSGP